MRIEEKPYLSFNCWNVKFSKQEEAALQRAREILSKARGKIEAKFGEGCSEGSQTFCDAGVAACIIDELLDNSEVRDWEVSE